MASVAQCSVLPWPSNVSHAGEAEIRPQVETLEKAQIDRTDTRRNDAHRQIRGGPAKWMVRGEVEGGVVGERHRERKGRLRTATGGENGKDEVHGGGHRESGP